MRVLHDLLYGTLTGYWLGVSDGRSEGPFMDLPTWDLRLRKVGFSGTELFLGDYPCPHNTTSAMVSPLLVRLVQEFTRRGITPTFFTGLLRTIGTENPAGRFLSVDIDAENFDIEDDDLVRNIVDHESGLPHHAGDGESEDREFVWQEGCMWVSCAVPDAGLESYTRTIETPKNRGADLLLFDSQGSVRAAFETPGILSFLYFRPYKELKRPLPPHYIEVKVSAVGLNWKDLGLTSGRSDANGDKPVVGVCGHRHPDGCRCSRLLRGRARVRHGARALWHPHACAGGVCAKAAAQRRCDRRSHNACGVHGCCICI